MAESDTRSQPRGSSGDLIEETRSAQQRPLRIQNLRKTFANGTVVACEDINLEIESDEFVVLLGPSGCGKTTTLRCISGLEQPDEGTIMIGDEDVTNHKPKDRDLAFVFQSVALFPHMTTRENIRFGLDVNTDLSADEKERRVREVAEILEIEELLDRKPEEASGGQQQRISIGRAMVVEPSAFLLDEPFSDLDANLRDQMQTEIKRLHEQLERAMIFVTHDQEEAMRLADKIVVMNDGHIQQVGHPNEIYREPSNRFVAEFIGSPSINLIDGSVEHTGESLEVSSDEFTLSLDRTSPRLTDGDHVTIGIRPDYMELRESGGYASAEVTLIEPNGSQSTVHLTTEQGMEMKAVIEAGQVEQGETVSIDFDTEDLLLFDTYGDRIGLSE